MAKKAELLEQAHKLKLDVSNKSTIKEITDAIEASGARSLDDSKQRTSEVAKAGKRSSKALEVAEEKEAKKSNKLADEKTINEQNKKVIDHTRSRLERKSKNYKEVAKLIEKSREYTLDEAIALILKTSKTKFDASVELHVRLNVDPKHADQNIRDNVVLPSGSGKKIRVAVYAEDDDLQSAKVAGADIAMSDELLQKIDNGEIDFDVLITNPKSMPKLGKYARTLGPKGLMPNPKSGTVATDIAKAVAEAKAGKVEYRVDSNGIIHLGVGKVSFTEESIRKNIEVLIASIKAAKPSSVKGAFIQSVFITTTMGPSIRITANL